MSDPTLVVVDALPPQVQGNPLWANGMVTRCEIQARYVFHSGLEVVPVADADDAIGPPAQVARWHKGYWEKHLTFTVERLGDEPVIPSFIGGADLMLLHAEVNPCAPVMHDGVLFKHVVTGEYRWLMLKSPSIQQGFPSPYALYWLKGKAVYKTTCFSQQMAQGG